MRRITRSTIAAAHRELETNASLGRRPSTTRTAATNTTRTRHRARSPYCATLASLCRHGWCETGATSGRWAGAAISPASRPKSGCPNNLSEIGSRDWRKCWSQEPHFRLSYNDLKIGLAEDPAVDQDGGPARERVLGPGLPAQECDGVVQLVGGQGPAPHAHLVRVIPRLADRTPHTAGVESASAAIASHTGSLTSPCGSFPR
jgi:hypothetical protein